MRSLISENQIVDEDFLSEEEFAVASGTIQSQITSSAINISSNTSAILLLDDKVDTISGTLRSTLLPAGENEIVYSSDITIDWSGSATKYLTLEGNPDITFENTVNGMVYRLLLIQDSVGSRIPTWSDTIRWGGGSQKALTTASGSIDVVTILRSNSLYLCDIATGF